ncbi:MAG: hypothetical protein IPH45_19490 [Bacteroidales bacterium]|nr:hypothetical protein [Bacteroidales bacterium]
MITNEWIWVKGKQATWHPGFYGKRMSKEMKIRTIRGNPSSFGSDDDYTKMYVEIERISSMEFTRILTC